MHHRSALGHQHGTRLTQLTADFVAVEDKSNALFQREEYVTLDQFMEKVSN